MRGRETCGRGGKGAVVGFPHLRLPFHSSLLCIFSTTAAAVVSRQQRWEGKNGALMIANCLPTNNFPVARLPPLALVMCFLMESKTCLPAENHSLHSTASQRIARDSSSSNSMRGEAESCCRRFPSVLLWGRGERESHDRTTRVGKVCHTSVS